MKRLAIYLKPFTSWRFLISFGFAWLLTNGWAYYLAFTPDGIPVWLRAFAASYLAFIYLPTTPEKLITTPIAIWLHIKVFAKDEKTHQQLQLMYSQAKIDWVITKNKIKKIFARKKKDM